MDGHQFGWGAGVRRVAVGFGGNRRLISHRNCLTSLLRTGMPPHAVNARARTALPFSIPHYIFTYRYSLLRENFSTFLCLLLGLTSCGILIVWFFFFFGFFHHFRLYSGAFMVQMLNQIIYLIICYVRMPCEIYALFESERPQSNLCIHNEVHRHFHSEWRWLICSIRGKYACDRSNQWKFLQSRFVGKCKTQIFLWISNVFFYFFRSYLNL